MKKFNIDIILLHYFACMLWATLDDDQDRGEHLDQNFTIDDISKGLYNKTKQEIKLFIKENKKTLIKSGLSEDQIGHDLFLTRNRHGAGFWDRDLGALGELLTNSTHELLKELNIYTLGNKIYAE